MNKTLIYPYANYLTPLKYQETDTIIHLINRLRMCRKQISAKLRTADIFAFLLFGHPPNNSCSITSTANPTSQAFKDNNMNKRIGTEVTLWCNRKQSYSTENASGPGSHEKTFMNQLPIPMLQLSPKQLQESLNFKCMNTRS